MKRFLLILTTGLIVMAWRPNTGYAPGDQVADFTLRNVDGNMVSLSDYSDQKGVIVIFDCNTCPYSKAYNERIIDLHKKLSPKGFPVIAINANAGPGDSFDDNVARAKSKQYEFVYLQDETQEVAKRFGATNTPHVFVLHKTPKSFEVAYIGAIDNNSRNAADADKKYVEDAVNALLAGEPVPVTKTRAIGCGIKWKDR